MDEELKKDSETQMPKNESKPKSFFTSPAQKLKELKLWLPIGIVIILIVVFASLLFSGQLYIGIKDKNQKVSLVYEVCGSTTIDKYNQIQSQQPQTDSETVKYEGDFKNLSNEIQSMPNSDKDPTCQYILFTYYQRRGDADNMKHSAGMIVDLNEDGRYINGKINTDLYSISTLRVIKDGGN